MESISKNQALPTVDPAISLAISRAEMEILVLQARLLAPVTHTQGSCIRDVSPPGGGK